jgi:oligopeptide/dipeptide ABC transporter ATP-binding protein
VGESGSGKSTILEAVMGLGEGEIVDGSVYYQGDDLTELNQKELRELRGNEISIVFQESRPHLNPTYTVGDQINDVLMAHTELTENERWERIYDLLDLMEISNPSERAHSYPHEFSGGMCQRIGIAMAIACEPKLLLADEPTSALDVTIQAQIIDLLLDLQEEMDLSILWITHNMGVIARVCDRVAVMYAGNIVENGTKEEIFKNPKHPYTAGLLEAVPRHDQDTGRRFGTIEGSPPDLQTLPSGCVYQDRCPEFMPSCAEARPNYYEYEPDSNESHVVKCFLHDDQPITNESDDSSSSISDDGDLSEIQPSNKGNVEP